MSLTNGKIHDGAVHVSIASTGESVDITEEDEQAIVIIQEEQLESSEIESSFPTHIISNEVRHSSVVRYTVTADSRKNISFSV